MRRVTQYGSLRAAWNSLELFDAKAAEDFLAEKLRRISADPGVQQVALEIILGFGVLSVEADREEQEALAAIETCSPPAPKEPENPPDVPW